MFSSTVVYTTYMVYRVTVAGLNPLQLTLLGTVLEITTLIFQVPTGVWADAYSRRLSVILGIMLMGIAFVIEGFLPYFFAILLAQIPWAIGSTFWSGALEAWIADEMADDQRIAQVYLRGAQIGLVGSLLGVPVSVALASIHLNIPIVTGGILFIVVGIFLILAMPEHRHQQSTQEEGQALANMGQALKESWHLIRRRPVLITMLLVAIFFGLFSEGFDRLWTAHVLADFQLPTAGHFQPIVWFGLISILSTLSSLGVTELVRRYVPLDKHLFVARCLFSVVSVMVVALLIFGLSNNFFVAIAAYLVASSLREIVGPIYTTWVTQHTPSGIRATMLSVSGECDAFGQIAGGPAVGAIGTFASLRVAMVVIAAALSPVLPLLLRTLRQGSGAEPLQHAQKNETTKSTADLSD